MKILRAALVLLAGCIALSARAQAPPLAPYRLVEGWPRLPPDVTMGWMAAVAVDARGDIYGFRRCPLRCSDGAHPGPGDPPASVLVFSAGGDHQGLWRIEPGTEAREAHGLEIDPSGFVWTTDVALHVVRKYRPDGELILTLGEPGIAGATSSTFNQPTDVFVARNGSVFVTDGYGNQRVMEFTADGRFVKSWGRRGEGPAEFRIPHSITEDLDGRLIVADRCGLGQTGCVDGRLQIFDSGGNYLGEWRPPSGMFAPQSVAVDAANRLYVSDTLNNRRVWILDAGSLAVVGAVEGAAGHGLAVTTDGGNLYVTNSATGIQRYQRDR